MTYLAIIVLALAVVGATINIIMGTRMELILHDIILFLISIGMLIRIRYKTKKSEKEKPEKEQTE